MPRKIRTFTATAALATGILIGATETMGAAGTGCSAEMQSITPQHSIYEPGKEFGNEVALFARLQLVDDYVAVTQGDCSGR